MLPPRTPAPLLRRGRRGAQSLGHGEPPHRLLHLGSWWSGWFQEVGCDGVVILQFAGLMVERLGCIRSLLTRDMGTRSSAREGMVCAKAGGLRKLGSHGGPYLQSKQVHTISVRCHWLRFHGLHMVHNLA